MRQPEVAGRPLRPLALVLSVLLAAPAALGLADALTAVLFLTEFLSAGALPALSAVTPLPRRVPVALPGAAADEYAAAALRAPRPLVLVHGVTPEGKDDPRAVRAAALLARGGFTVTVPTVPGLAAGRLRPDDVRPVVAAIGRAAAGARAVTLVGVSIGAGPALLAAADPRVGDRVGLVLTLGGYASAAELLRFFLTGDYAFGDLRGHVAHDPATVRAFLAANADLIGPEGQRLADDRAGALRFLASPPPGVRALLEALSPERVAGDVRARLLLVHGRADPAVPFTESLRLAAARPAGTRVVLLGAVEHVEGAPAARATVSDLLALFGVTYAVLASR